MLFRVFSFQVFMILLFLYFNMRQNHQRKFQFKEKNFPGTPNLHAAVCDPSHNHTHIASGRNLGYWNLNAACLGIFLCAHGYSFHESWSISGSNIVCYSSPDCWSQHQHHCHKTGSFLPVEFRRRTTSNLSYHAQLVLRRPIKTLCGDSGWL